MNYGPTIDPFTNPTTDPNPDPVTQYQTQGINKCELRVMHYEKQVITFIVAINISTIITSFISSPNGKLVPSLILFEL